MSRHGEYQKYRAKVNDRLPQAQPGYLLCRISVLYQLFGAKDTPILVPGATYVWILFVNHQL